MISSQEILNILPHRSPFLFVDRILKLENGNYCQAEKWLDPEETFFQGHFPDQPIMPGVLLIESMAQVGGILILSTLENLTEKKKAIFYLGGVEKARFKKPIFPDDILEIHVQKEKQRANLWICKGQIFVKNQLASQATFQLINPKHTA